MVDVCGFQNSANREWCLKTQPCRVCQSKKNSIVANLEWSLRNSLTNILVCEVDMFTSLFEKFPDLVLYSNHDSANYSDPLRFSLVCKETFGVYAIVHDHKTPVYPILVGGKMYTLILNNNSVITKSIWSSEEWSGLDCIFCSLKNVWPTTFIVKGKYFSIGLLAWTNYLRVNSNKKHGLVMYTKGNVYTPSNCPLLQKYVRLSDNLRQNIGNKRIFHGGYVFVKLLENCLSDLYRICNSLSSKPLVVNKMRKYIRQNNINLNTGVIDSVIGKRTKFIYHTKSGNSIQSGIQNITRTGRFKEIIKIDYILICKLFQLENMTSLYAKKIPIDYHDSDTGFICPIATSEHYPGILNLEPVIGIFISSISDCVPDDVIEKYLSTVTTDLQLYDFMDCQTDWYLIINQKIYVHAPLDGQTLQEWVIFLRKELKRKYMCIEIYPIDNNLYVIHSLENTMYKFMPDGLAYTAMELSTLNTFEDMTNILGPTCALIPFISCNKSTRNTFMVHALRQAAGKNILREGEFECISHTVDLKNPKAMVEGIPFWTEEANILILPEPFNIEDAFVVSKDSVEKGLFNTEHTQVITIIFDIIQNNSTRNLITAIPCEIRKQLALFKYAKTGAAVISSNKNLLLECDPDDNSINRALWLPNSCSIPDRGVKIVKFVRAQHDSKEFYHYTIRYTEKPTLGSKIVVLDGCNKGIISNFLSKDDLPELIDQSGRAIDIDIDIIQNPTSIKRLALNFLYTGEEVYLNDSFKHTVNEKIKLLQQKPDYLVRNKKTKVLYHDSEGRPVRAILYRAFVLYMWKQTPSSFLHSAELNITPINNLTGQPECRNNREYNKNCHAFGFTEMEREVLIGLGANSLLESLHSCSDPGNMTVTEEDGSTVQFPLSVSTRRALDMCFLNGINFNFNF